MNTKSKLKAISIGIAAIMMVSLLAAVTTVSASPGVDVTDCWIGDDNKVYFTIYSDAKAEGHMCLNINGEFEERKRYTLNAGETATLSFRDYRWNGVDDVEVCVDCVATSCCTPPGPTPPTPTPTPPLPDLEVEKTVEFVEGGFVVHYKVTNTGDGSADASKVCKSVDDVCTEVKDVPALGPDGFACGDFDLETCQPGEAFTVKVCADCTHIVDESDENNNCVINYETCPTPTPTPLPDLIVEKTVEFVDGAFIVHYKVTNIGDGEAGTSEICKSVDDVCTEVKTVPALGANGGFYCGDFDLETCQPGETFTVTVCADCTHLVDESNENNNCETNYETCPEACMPDLVVSDKWEDCEDGQMIVHFIIANIGDAAAGESEAALYIDRVRVQTQNIEVSALGPSGTFSSAFAAEDCPPGTAITVKVCADDTHVVDESNEDNNCMETDFTCPLVPQPDLIVSEKWETPTEWPPNDEAPSFVVHYTVTNIGNAEAGPSKVGKYVNGALCPHCVQEVPALGPDATFCGEFEPEVCPCDQTLNVTVCADIYDVVDESDETNNCMINWVTCPPAEPDIEVDKTVWDGTAWVDEIDADVGDVVTFNSTIHNSGFCCNLTNIMVWDVLSPSLEYVGVVNTPAPDEIVNYPDGSTELRWFLTGLVLEPCESETFLIRAEVLDCGVDINTQYARAMADCTGEFIEGEDFALVNGLGRPSIETDKRVQDPDTGDWVDFIRVARGETVVFRTTTHNDGICCDLTDIQIADRLPRGFRYIGSSLLPWDISLWVWGTELMWFIPGPLEPCESITILTSARAIDNGLWTNTHEAHAWSECRQTIVGDDDDASVRVVDPANIGAYKFCAPWYLDVGDYFTCDIDVDNYGDWTLNPVQVVDTLPAGISYHSSDPTADDVTVNPSGTTTLTWNNVGPIAPNGDIEIELVARMEAGPAGERLWNRVDVTGTWRRGTVTDWYEDWVERN